MNAVHISSAGVQDYVTPLALIEEITRRFGVSFVLDLAASNDNHRCTFWITQDDDSLGQDWKVCLEECIGWAGIEPCAWLNPPFRGVEPWMEKCKVEASRGVKIISLTLASLGTGWYRNHVEGEAMSFILRERVVFEGQKDPFPKDLMVTLWGMGMTGLGFWSRKHV